MTEITIVPGRHGRDSAVWWVDAYNRSVEVAGKRGLHVELLAKGKPVGRVRQVLLDPVHERWLIAAEGLPEGCEVTLRVATSLAGPLQQHCAQYRESRPNIGYANRRRAERVGARPSGALDVLSSRERGYRRPPWTGTLSPRPSRR